MADMQLPKFNWPEIGMTAGICLFVIVIALALPALGRLTSGSDTQ